MVMTTVSRQKRYLQIYRILCKKLPKLREDLENADLKQFRQMERSVSDSRAIVTVPPPHSHPPPRLSFQVKDGLSAARSDDIGGLKGAVIDWVTVSPYLAADSNNRLCRNTKETRGYHNAVLGALLCPTDLDWSDEG
jgi:hypothetical protein